MLLSLKITIDHVNGLICTSALNRMLAVRASSHLTASARFRSLRRPLQLPGRKSAAMSSLKRKEPPTSASQPKRNGDLTSFFGRPKISPSGGGKAGSLTKAIGAASTTADAPPLKFDKDKWAASLTEEQRKLLKLEIDTLDPSWLGQLKDEVTSPSFLELKRFLQKEIDSGQKIYPPLEDVYSW